MCRYDGGGYSVVFAYFSSANWNSHHPNISPVIGGYKQPSKSAQSIEITGFIEKSKPPKIIFFYTLLPLTAWADKGKIKGKPRAGNTIIWQTADSDVLSQTE
mgnify:CR=1 FL=1